VPFRALGQEYIALSYFTHSVLCFRVIHLFRERARLFCAFLPMLFVVDESHGFAPHLLRAPSRVYYHAPREGVALLWVADGKYIVRFRTG